MVWVGPVRVPLARTGPRTRTHSMPIKHIVPPPTHTHSMGNSTCTRHEQRTCAHRAQRVQHFRLDASHSASLKRGCCGLYFGVTLSNTTRPKHICYAWQGRWWSGLRPEYTLSKRGTADCHTTGGAFWAPRGSYWRKGPRGYIGYISDVFDKNM